MRGIPVLIFVSKHWETEVNVINILGQRRLVIFPRTFIRPRLFKIDVRQSMCSTRATAFHCHIRDDTWKNALWRAVLGATYIGEEFSPVRGQSSSTVTGRCKNREKFNGPFTLAMFAAISAAILRHVNYWRFRGDLNHQKFTRLEIALEIAAKIAAKIASVNGP